MACEAKHPATSVAIRVVPTTVISTTVTLSICMSNHKVHKIAMCSSCCLVYQILMRLFALICHRPRVVHIV